MSPLDPQPALVLFDLDDTLCDYGGARGGRLRIAFELAEETSGRQLTAPIDAVVAESIQLHPHGVDHFPDLLARYGIRDANAIDAAVSWYLHHRFHGLQLFPDAIETLETVRAGRRDRRLGMVTNGPADVQSAKIDLLGLRPYFDFCLISGEYGFWKPDREIFQEALELGSSRPRDAVMIGDSPEHDIAGAEAAGLLTIWIDRTARSWPAELEAPTRVAADLHDVRRLLGNKSGVR